MSNHRMVGSMLVASGYITSVGILIAEGVYGRDYNIRDYTISDLARKYEPGMIFNLSLIISGVLLALCALYIYQEHLKDKIRAFAALLGLSGLGMIGIGIYSIYTGPIHMGYALTTFGLSTLAIFVASSFVQRTFSQISLVLGSIALISILGINQLTEIMGVGGAEKVLVYTCLLWIIAFGGYWLTREYDHDHNEQAVHSGLKEKDVQNM